MNSELSTIELIAINEAIEILGRLQVSTANGAMFAWKRLKNAEKYLDSRVSEHFAA